MHLVKLQVPARLEYRELATRLVALACKLAFSQVPAMLRSEEATYELVSAAGEAFNNVALHGYPGRPPGVLTIAAYSDRQSIVVEFSDDGAPFDPGSVEAPDLAELPESGLGLHIMRSFTDEFHYQPGPPNVLRLVKLIG